MKTCSKCKETKEYSAFQKNKSNKDGYQYQCAACRVEGCAKYFSSLTREERDKRVKSAKEWKEKNADKVKETAKAYAKEHKAERAAAQTKRKANQQQRTPTWLTEDDFIRIKCFYQVAAMRNRESDTQWHVDHIVPMNGKQVCGLHVPWNLQVITATENLRKHNIYG